MQYDFEKKFGTLVNNLMLNGNMQNLDKFDMANVQSLGVEMPAKTLQNFLELEIHIEAKEN